MAHGESLPRLRRPLLKDGLKLESLPLVYFVAHIRLRLLLSTTFATSYQFHVQRLKLFRLLALHGVVQVVVSVRVLILIIVNLKRRRRLVQHREVLLLWRQLLNSQEFQAVIRILPHQLLINGHVRLRGGKRVELVRICFTVVIIVCIALCLVSPIVHIRCIPRILTDAATECWLGHARALLLIDSVVVVLRALHIWS